MSSVLLLGNVGSRLMWTQSLHLVFGNLMIGLVEAGILTYLFVVSYRRGWWRLILANYFSAFVGMLVTTLVGSVALSLTGQEFFFRVTSIVLGLYVFFMIVTVFLEWPFFHWAIPREDRSMGTSLRATVVCQLVSYALCLPVLHRASITPYAVNVEPVRELDFVRPPDLWVYYIGADRSELRRIRLDGTSDELVGPFRPDHPPHIAPQWNAGKARMELVVKDSVWNDSSILHVLLEDFPTVQPQKTWRTMDYRTAIDYRSEDTDWKVNDPFYLGLMGMQAWKYGGDKKVRQFGLETPFLRGFVIHVTLLPSDQLVFEFSGQIAVMDLESGRLAPLVEGESPVVALGAEKEAEPVR